MSAPAVGRRERTKAANRAAILAAARDVFAEEGYGAVGVRDIIRRTDLASGTFYNYFPDKDAIFRALVDGRRRGGAPPGARRAPPGADGAGLRRGRLPRVLRVHRRGPGVVRVHAPQPRHAARRGSATTCSRRAPDELAEDLRAAIAAGHVPPVDVDYCAHAMVAVGLELGARLAERDPPDVDGATRFAAALFLGALGTLRA